MLLPRAELSFASLLAHVQDWWWFTLVGNTLLLLSIKSKKSLAVMCLSWLLLHCHLVIKFLSSLRVLKKLGREKNGVGVTAVFLESMWWKMSLWVQIP